MDSRYHQFWVSSRGQVTRGLLNKLIKQPLYCFGFNWMLAHRSTQPLLWTSWNTLLVWYFLYTQCHRFSICANMAPALCTSTSSLCILSINLQSNRSVVYCWAWVWVLKLPHPLSLPPKIHRPTFEEAWSCPGNYG